MGLRKPYNKPVSQHKARTRSSGDNFQVFAPVMECITTPRLLSISVTEEYLMYINVGMASELEDWLRTP